MILNIKIFDVPNGYFPLRLPGIVQQQIIATSYKKQQRYAFTKISKVLY
jgi:hypothetical protein